MRSTGTFRSIFSVVLSGLCVSLSVDATPNSRDSLLWYADHKTVNALEIETGTLARSVSLKYAPDVLAVDARRGDVWLLSRRHLVKLNPSGEVALEIDMSRLRPDIDHPTSVTVNPYDGAVWVAGGKEIVKLSANGELLRYWRAPKRIEAIELDLDETLWVLADRHVHHLSAGADLLQSVDLETHLRGNERLAIDALGGILWIADRRRLLRVELGKVTEPPREAVFLPEEVETGEPVEEQRLGRSRAVAVHPRLGTVWIATHRHLHFYDRGGMALKTVQLPAAIGKVLSIVFDPRSLSLWIGGTRGLGRFTASGELVAILPVDKEADLLAIAGFTLYPSLGIEEPADGALTNNSRPRIRLSLGATCSGAPCLMPEAYISSLALDAALNGVAVGDAFLIEGSEAYYNPAPLPEGLNTLAVQATDLFGHRSESVTSRFTVDTVPPKFLSTTPADGSTVNQAAITISGQVDDPSASIVLNDSQGNAAMGGASFSFEVVLEIGINTVLLTATDPAGNVAQLPLRLTYQPPVESKLEVAEPIVNGNSATVSGNFTTGPNTGVTVNGIVAEIFGNQFVANGVPLQAGNNTIAVVLTTLDGEIIQKELSITAGGESSFEIEQVPPRRRLIRTIAGTGEAGYSGDGGPASSAQLDFPDVSAVAPDGSLYVYDSGNAVIRRIAPDGIITTVAGNGTFGISGDGGPATAASIDWVTGIAFGPDGDWYLADSATIRRIDKDGIIDRVAGSVDGYAGDGGPALDALFGEFLVLAVASDGTIYVSDSYNHRVRRIDVNGIVTTIAGGDEVGYSGDGGPASEALLNNPSALAIAPNGDLYFADTGNSVIRRIDTNGNITKFAGNGSDGDPTDPVPALTAPLPYYIAALAFDPSGHLYILDPDYAKVRRIDSEGILETIAGKGEQGYAGDNGPPSLASFSFPYGMAIGADGTLYVSDGGNNRIRGFNVYLREAHVSARTAEFRLRSSGTEVDRIDVDFDGDGSIDRSVLSDRIPLQYEYPGPGVYTTTFTITDRSSNLDTVSRSVVVKDLGEIDSTLRGIYGAMLDRLRVGNVEGALNMISAGMRPKYEAVFNALRPQLATVVDRLGTLEEGTIGDELAEYVLVRRQGEESQAFLIYFLRSEDGVWRIDGM